MINDYKLLSGKTPTQYFSECEPYSDYFQQITASALLLPDKYGTGYVGRTQQVKIEKELTQEELAEKVRTTKSSISKIKNNITKRVITQLAPQGGELTLPHWYKITMQSFKI